MTKTTEYTFNNLSEVKSYINTNIKAYGKDNYNLIQCRHTLQKAYEFYGEDHTLVIYINQINNEYLVTNKINYFTN